MKTNIQIHRRLKWDQNIHYTSRRQTISKLPCAYKTHRICSLKPSPKYKIVKDEIIKRTKIPINVLKDVINLERSKNSLKKLTNLKLGLGRTVRLIKEIGKYNKENEIIESTECKSNKLYAGELEFYQFGKEIGRGAYAIVRECTHKLQVCERYAAKIYEKSKLYDQQKKRNVTREIKVMGLLNHPNIARLYEAIDGPKEIYLIMERIRGGSLFNYIRSRENRRLEETEARRFFGQIVSAINYCHIKGIIHRDLKFENLLLDENKNIKVIDFGFSTIVPVNCKLQMYCGTPSYMAPEIFSKRGYFGPPVDVWAMGVILYGMLTGKFPFQGSNENELYKNVSRGLYSVPINISSRAKKLISKMLATNPIMRPTCTEIMQDEFLHNEKISSFPRIPSLSNIRT